MPTITDSAATRDSGKHLGYATLRLAIGMSMLIHGVGRFPKMSVFAHHVVKQFNGSILPPSFANGFAHITPFVECIIGISVLFGLFTRWGLTLGGLWMVILIFGSTLIAQYNIVGIQLIYSLIFYHLLMNLEFNAISVDGLLSRRKRELLLY